MGVTRRRLSARSAPTKPADHVRRRAAEDLGRGRVLLEHAADVEDRDAVAHLHRFLDVVGHEHDGLLHLALEAEELVLQPDAGDRVDGAERLVHEEHGRVGRERARHPDPLALPARELRRDSASRYSAGSSPTRSSSSSTRASVRAFGQPSSFGTVAMLVAMVWCGNRPTCWIT